jgi:gamma-glutamyltranspeptidase/glutathione hydrolase
MPLNALDDNYLKQRMANFSFDRNHLIIRYQEEAERNLSMETTHYSIIDQFGNAIAAKPLNRLWFQSITVTEWGFIEQ